MANEIEQLTSERNLLSQQKNQLIQENAKCIFIIWLLVKSEALNSFKTATEQSELNDQLMLLLKNKGEDISSLKNKYNDIKGEYSNYKVLYKYIYSIILKWNKQI